MDELEKNLELIRKRIAAACKLSGRSPAEIEFLPVTKTHPAERIRDLFRLGFRRFGENYAQEMITKAADLADLPISWVFIGQIQSNKISKIVQCASEIQTVGSFRHAEQISRHAQAFGKIPYPIYLAVNAGNEATKGGVGLEEVKDLATRIQQELPILSVKGLMSIPPPLQDPGSCAPDRIPDLYRAISAASRECGQGQLSLGMSGDLACAIYAGSTCIRIGTDLLGRRPKA